MPGAGDPAEQRRPQAGGQGGEEPRAHLQVDSMCKSTMGAKYQNLKSKEVALCETGSPQGCG